MITARVLLLLLVSLPAWADTFYVRPALAGEYGLEDGTSYANAFDGYFDVAWGTGAGQAGPGDTLIVCGEFNDNTFLQPTASGTSGSPIIIDGDCSSQGDRARAKLNAGTGIIAAGNGAQSWIIFRNLELTGGSGITQRVFNITSTSFVSATPINVVAENIIVHDTMGEGATPRSVDYQCLRIDGSNVTIRNVQLYNCEGDGIYAEGNDHLIEDLRVWNVDLSGIPYGDCIQYGGGTSSTEYAHNRNVVRRLDCDRTNKTTKHGVIFGCDSGAGTSFGLVLEDSYIRGANFNVAVHFCDEVTIRRNRFELAKIPGSPVEARGIGTFNGGSGETITAESNIFDMRTSVSGAYGIFIDQSPAFTLNAQGNVFLSSGGALSRGVFVFSPTGGTATLRNNVFVGTAVAGIQVHAGATATATHNAFHNNAADCIGVTCSGSVVADPQFVGGASPTTAEGFRLSSSSPLVRSGTYVGPILDFRGRPFALKPSIGAFEFDRPTQRIRR